MIGRITIQILTLLGLLGGFKSVLFADELGPEIILQGYSSVPENILIANNLFDEFIGGNHIAPQQATTAIVFYSGPDILEDDVFQPPENADIPDQQLEYLSEQRFFDRDCSVQKLTFPDGIHSMIFAIDDSNAEEADLTELCMLLAIATALGVDSGITDGFTSDDIRNLLQEMEGN